MTVRPVRVLVVDDSAFVRKVLREVFATRAEFEFVGAARNGVDALERIRELRPDVVVLDLMMPELDGLGVLRAMPAEGAPRVVVLTTADADSTLVIAALEAGAVDFVHKPTALATDRLYEVAAPLLDRVLAAADARWSVVPDPPASPAPWSGLPTPRGVQVIVVGTSTGGPQALHRLLTALPGNLPAPVAVVLHIPPGYTEALAKRLDQACALEVVEASEDLELRPGRVVVARAGLHLRLAREGTAFRARLDVRPLASPHRPSVDVLFASAAETFGRHALGVVLTGMGDDGLAGSRAIHAAGGAVLTEAESSCVVYGMPRCVREAGLSAAEAPIDAMAGAILRHL